MAPGNAAESIDSTVYPIFRSSHDVIVHKQYPGVRVLRREIIHDSQSYALD